MRLETFKTFVFGNMLIFVLPKVITGFLRKTASWPTELESVKTKLEISIHCIDKKLLGTK